MKKIGFLLVVLALGVAPGFANDIPDGADCAATDAPGSVTTFLNAEDPTTAEVDRGAICVSDGDASNGAEFYIGGEAQAEVDGDPAYGGACGAIIVGGEPVAGEPDWNTEGFHCD